MLDVVSNWCPTLTAVIIAFETAWNLYTGSIV